MKKQDVPIDPLTIKDFGDQWSHYQDNQGFWGSLEFLKDLFGPLLTVADIRATRVADIGSGTGRTVQMLLDAGAAHVVAVEPSEGVHALRENMRDRMDDVTVLQTTGDKLPAGLNLDWAVSIGVIHHIHNPLPTVRAMYTSLKPGGRSLIWVYGKEGNSSYLHLLQPVRYVTTRLPHAVLRGLSICASWLTPLYIAGCRILPLPFRGYARTVFSQLPLKKRELIIYDQLNPAYAKYYAREEVIQLMEQAGFGDIHTYHRHACSWSVLGRKPDGEPS